MQPCVRAGPERQDQGAGCLGPATPCAMARRGRGRMLVQSLDDAPRPQQREQWRPSNARARDRPRTGAIAITGRRLGTLTSIGVQ